jgi:hypothetical protein
MLHGYFAAHYGVTKQEAYSYVDALQAVGYIKPIPPLSQIEDEHRFKLTEDGAYALDELTTDE